MSDKLEGQVAVVTGASRGMGAGIARLLGQRGASVALIDVLDAGPVAREIGAKAFSHVGNVASEADWEALHERVLQTFGPASILVNAAGVLGIGEMVDTSREAFAKVIDVNLIGPFLGMRTFAPDMIRLSRGSIVNIASIEALRGTNGLSAYTASKWGLRGMSKSAAMELGPKGVRVNVVHPGAINTPMSNPTGVPQAEFDEHCHDDPLQRGASTEELARAVAFLASDEASYITGADLTVDGGRTIGAYMPFLPGAPDRGVPGPEQYLVDTSGN